MVDPTAYTEMRRMLERTVVELKTLRAERAARERSLREPVAIVGTSCRFPGAPGIEEFWALLAAGGDAVSEVPAARWNAARLYDPEPGSRGRSYTSAMGALETVDAFDAELFGVSPREADAMDPQQRLLLEVSWEALERAGIDPTALRGTATGVFLGIASGDYYSLSLAGPLAGIGPHTLTGNRPSVAAGRLSYVYGIHGPSVALDTACSSSLVAVHLALESLRRRECDAALVGGVNLILSPDSTLGMCQLRALSTTGRCKTFDASADGYVRGEGCGVVVLKRLSDAEREGDPILAVIRGSAVNQDGRSNGLTAPSGPAQEQVIRRALAEASLEPKDVDYVEAHGTGTSLGDPIEVEALQSVLAEGRPADDPLWIGTVKTNIGHLEAAAGVAGLIKVVLSLRAGELPANLHLREPSPDIDWSRAPVRVPTARTAWPARGALRRAGVSSFGFSGTNAHVIVEEAPRRTPAAAEPSSGPYAIAVSGRTESALREQASRYGKYVAESGAELADVVSTSWRRRSHFEHRAVVVGESGSELAASLQALGAGRAEAGAVVGRARAGESHRAVFVFPGHGSQWAGMGRDLYERDASFRAALEECDAAVREQAGWSVVEELRCESPRLDRNEVVQPLLFALGVSLAAWWRSRGVEPSAVVGHSMGEIAAAAVSGALSIGEAARVICVRSRVLRRVVGQGGMVLVELDLASARRVITGRESRLSVAVNNSPGFTVLSGDRASLGEVVAELEGRGVFCRWVKVEYASHGPQMEGLREELLEGLSGLRPGAGAIAMESTLLGASVDGSCCDAEYWVRNLREPVLFAGAIESLASRGHDLFVEMSPNPLLVPAMEEGLRAGGHRGRAVGSLRRGEGAERTLLESLCALHASGLEVDGARFGGGAGGRCAALPTYPFRRERFWLKDVPAGVPASGLSGTSHPYISRATESSLQSGLRIFETELGPSSFSDLRDHRVAGTAVLPAAAWVELALAAVASLERGRHVALEGMELRRMLAFDGDAGRRVQVSLCEESPGRGWIRIASGDAEAGGRWTEHVAARFDHPLDGDAGFDPTAAVGERLAPERLYEALARGGLAYGPSFRSLVEIERGPRSARGSLRVPSTSCESAERFLVHPSLLDGALQLAGAVLRIDAQPAACRLPVAIGRALLDREAGAPERAELALVEASGDAVKVDVRLADPAGAVRLSLLGVTLKSVDRERAEEAADRALHAVAWVTQALPGAPRSPLRGAYLLAGEDSASLRELARDIEARGGAVQREDGAHGVDPVERDAGGLAGVVWHAGVGGEAAAWAASAAAQAARLLDVVRAFAGRDRRDAPRLWIVTRGAQAVDEADPPVEVDQAALWGLARSLQCEHPELRCTLVDLPVAVAAEDAERIVDELAHDGAEDQIARRGAERRVARIERSPLGPEGERSVPAGGRPFALGVPRSRSLADLAFRSRDRRAPGPGEVEIAVEAASLNFIDVMKSLGIYPGSEPETAELGSDCSGVVVRIGSGVTGLREGDAVIACGRGCLASHLVTRAEFAVLRPARLDVAAAAAAPIAWMTAWHALRNLARLRPGERVLIHSAAGGTGLAVVRLAQRIGARVIVTAGTPEKRTLLRALGVEAAFDSRSLDFVAGVAELCGGRGVDVVVNSLTGEAAARSLDLLGEDGRFVELGKSDIYADRLQPLGAFRRRLTYASVDLAGLAERRPERFAELLRRVVGELERGDLVDLPVECVPASRAVDAFRMLSRGAHVGKLALDLRDSELRLAESAAPRAALREDAAYLVTGGRGALGARVARWLVARGARRIALLGRSPAGARSVEAAAELEKAGATVLQLRADAADRGALAAALGEIERDLGPLAGVFHLAGELDDGLAVDLDAARLHGILAGKLAAACHLDALTRDRPLDLFVLFSSSAGMLGAAGQASYAAANAGLDALAQRRRAYGLPALSVAWGPFGGAGLAAAEPARLERLASRGFRLLDPEADVERLDALVHSGRCQVGVFDLDVRAYQEFFPSLAASPFWSALSADAPPGATRSGEALRRELSGLSRAAGLDVVLALVRTELARVLGTKADRLDDDAALQNLGVDSLIALELRNRLEVAAGVPLTAASIFACADLAALAATLFERLRPEVGGAAGGARPDELEAVAAMDDDEIAGFLDGALEGI